MSGQTPVPRPPSRDWNGLNPEGSGPRSGGRGGGFQQPAGCHDDWDTVSTGYANSLVTGVGNGQVMRRERSRSGGRGHEMQQPWAAALAWKQALVAKLQNYPMGLKWKKIKPTLDFPREASNAIHVMGYIRSYCQDVLEYNGIGNNMVLKLRAATMWRPQGYEDDEDDDRPDVPDYLALGPQRRMYLLRRDWGRRGRSPSPQPPSTPDQNEVGSRGRMADGD